MLAEARLEVTDRAAMPFEFSPQKLVYGGDAIGYHEGHIIFLPRALPNERLEVELERETKGVWHARPVRLVVASPDRVEPPCPYFGRCGGCQYQHLSPERQPEVKREILRETLRRIGKISWQGVIPVHAASPWNYRNQAHLKVGPGPEGRVEVGFFERESHRLVPVAICRILSPLLNRILAELRTGGWLARLASCREIELLADDRDERVMAVFRGDMPPDGVEGFAKLALECLPGMASVTIESAAARRSFGEPALGYRVGRFQHRISPGSFFQASRFLLHDLVAAAANDEPRDGTPAERRLALDLFAGVGLFALPLAQNFERVIAVEAQRQAAEDLVVNVRQNGFQNVQTIGVTVYDFLRRFAEKNPSLVILDPPRAGVGRYSLNLLVGLRPARIHYVSCHPATMARDLRDFFEAGYRIDSVEMFDFFPQTFHIESLVRLGWPTV